MTLYPTCQKEQSADRAVVHACCFGSITTHEIRCSSNLFDEILFRASDGKYSYLYIYMCCMSYEYAQNNIMHVLFQLDQCACQCARVSPINFIFRPIPLAFPPLIYMSSDMFSFQTFRLKHQRGL